jgi:MYXO-CTERM domain-containing protein
MFQLYRIDAGVGTPLSDMQVLSGVFRPSTQLVMSVAGDQLTVEAHNTVNSEKLALQGTITPNDFGGAGVDWYGTVPPGNSNVYSQLEISYPGTADPAPCQKTTTPPPKPAAKSGCGCAMESPPSRGGTLVGTLLLLGALAASRGSRSVRKKRGDRSSAGR